MAWDNIPTTVDSLAKNAVIEQLHDAVYEMQQSLFLLPDSAHQRLKSFPSTYGLISLAAYLTSGAWHYPGYDYCTNAMRRQLDSQINGIKSYSYYPYVRLYFLNETTQMPETRTLSQILTAALGSSSWSTNRLLRANGLLKEIADVLDYLKPIIYVSLDDFQTSERYHQSVYAGDFFDPTIYPGECDTPEDNWNALVASVLDIFADLKANYLTEFEDASEIKYVSGPTGSSPYIDVAFWHIEKGPTWASGVAYYRGDWVYCVVDGYGDNYWCSTNHTSSSSNKPGEDDAPWGDDNNPPFRPEAYFVEGSPTRIGFKTKVVYNVNSLPDCLKNATTAFLYFKAALPSYNYSQWQSGTSYAYNTCVWCDGKAYKCRTAHTAASSNKPPAVWYDPDYPYYWKQIDTYGYGGISVPVYLNSSLIGTVNPGRSFGTTEQKISFNPQNYLPTATWTIEYGWDDVEDVFSIPNYTPSPASPSAWQSGISYAVDDFVSSGGNNYICIQAHTSSSANMPPNTTYWGLAPGWVEPNPGQGHQVWPVTHFVYKSLDFKDIFIKPVYGFG